MYKRDKFFAGGQNSEDNSMMITKFYQFIIGFFYEPKLCIIVGQKKMFDCTLFLWPVALCNSSLLSSVKLGPF